MFEFLNAIDADELLGAVSYAIRGLTHLGRPGGAQRLLTLPDEFTATQEAVGRQILAAVEATEHEPVNQLDSEQVRQYVGDLYALVDARWDHDDAHSAEAERMLAQFRRTAHADAVWSK